MGKKKAIKKRVDKQTRVRTRSASSPEQINGTSKKQQKTPQSRPAVASPLTRTTRPDAETVPTRPPTRHGLVRLCQFLRDHSGGALVVPKKTV